MKNREKYENEIINSLGKNSCVFIKNHVLKNKDCHLLPCDTCNNFYRQWLNEVGYDHYKYCPNCGQKIDLSEVEDESERNV